ncbi:MAG: alpha/beta fold hydrolase [Chloroflexota bacterium]
MNQAERNPAHPRRTFVLVHGSYDGGWAWSQVAALLRTAGHEVYTPTLTGLGERVHLRHPGITLDTHLQDIVNVLLYEDLREVILVGWSYGGMIITGVAERAPERLAHLVYLDAYVPQDGQSVVDLLGPQVASEFEELARTQGDGWRLPFTIPVNDNRPRVDALLNPRKQALAVTNVRATALPRTYIFCSEKPDIPFFAHFAAAAQRAREDGAWRYRELPTGHDAVWTMPQELTDLLLEIT